ncbi:hypothetical protein EA58_14380 [Photobacterium galatheae]|uniref:Uncharacterized protein n=1 Tax=Photobacterium galatheae TaxID=1654360 RepID=A0A066RKR1_9GAMM|nr:hypothetical protein EA58_14380 [Photobacterium galatheae]
MHKVKVSHRYGHLFVSSVVRQDCFDEVQVFPQSAIPLVFRTDASARTIGKMVASEIESGDEISEHSLVVDGCYLCSASKPVIEKIVHYWRKQSICLGEIVIVKGGQPEAQSTSESKALLQAIYEQCIS